MLRERFAQGLSKFRRKTMPPSVDVFDARVGALEARLSTLIGALDIGSATSEDFLAVQRAHGKSSFRVPTDLLVSQLPIKRVLAIGECQAEIFLAQVRVHAPGCMIDHVVFNNYTSLPMAPPAPPRDYDFQLVHLPLRSIMPEAGYLRLPFEESNWAQFHLECKERLLRMLSSAMRWNVDHGILTFVSNFMLPQQNAAGRLLPRNDFRNPVHFVRLLNDALDEAIRNHPDAYILDSDAISATFGRRFFQDDVLWLTNHNSLLGDYDLALDAGRLEPPVSVTEQYKLRVAEFTSAWWQELVAMYRTIRQVDQVKLIVLDLDDTLWRGIAAEHENTYLLDPAEGWPLGLSEALLFLKRRGVMLAIVSKNDEARIAELWAQKVPSYLSMNDFISRKINWKPKAENVAEVIAVANVLPRNVVFIDDNPVERAAVKAVLPDIRVLGADLYCLRRILLWSSETQVAALSSESMRRTEMVQAQIQRDASRQTMSHEEFLASLNVRVRLYVLPDATDRRFARALELLNKTNQFNTTGKRWTRAEASEAIKSGNSFYAFEATDKFTDYGMVGVAITSGSRVSQFVMSCRVIGLGVETSVISELGRLTAQAGSSTIEGLVEKTEANTPVRDLFERCGLAPAGSGKFVAKVNDLCGVAPHVKINIEQ
jgi:FkbH-like protein